MINAVVNPALEWLVNPARGFQPFFGPAGEAANLALTSVILAVLVALIASRIARRRFAVPARRSSFPGFLVVRAVFYGLLGLSWPG